MVFGVRWRIPWNVKSHSVREISRAFIKHRATRTTLAHQNSLARLTRGSALFVFIHSLRHRTSRRSIRNGESMVGRCLHRSKPASTFNKYRGRTGRCDAANESSARYAREKAEDSRPRRRREEIPSWWIFARELWSVWYPDVSTPQGLKIFGETARETRIARRGPTAVIMRRGRATTAHNGSTHRDRTNLNANR